MDWFPEESDWSGLDETPSGTREYHRAALGWTGTQLSGGISWFHFLVGLSNQIPGQNRKLGDCRATTFVTSPLCSMNKYIATISVKTQHNFMHNISHNYMFQPILGHLQVVPFSLASVVA